MLKQEPLEAETQAAAPSALPAAERRVSPEELTAALTALEASKQQAARQLEGTVPIGQVVSEMGLDATPEEIWTQVQQQRTQKAAEEEAKQTPSAPPPESFAQAAKQTYQQRFPAVSPLPILPLLPRPSRPLMRRLSKVKGWVWIVFWCTGGFGLISAFSHPHNPGTSLTNSGQTITINSDLGTQTVDARNKDVVINGDMNKVTLQGKARSVTINGDFVSVTGETPQDYTLNGTGDTVKWTGTAAPTAP